MRFQIGERGKCHDSPLQQNGTKQRARKKTLTPDMADTLVKAVKILEDGNEVKIILAIDPGSIPTAQGKGAFVDNSGHIHFFTKPKQRKAEQTFQSALEPYADNSGRWGEVPIELDFKLFFPYPESTPKKYRHKIGPHCKKPDGDNVCKGLIDSMTKAGFWKDDSYINTYHIYKRYTTGPSCIVVKITNLKPKFDALYRATEEHDSPTLFNTSDEKPAETNPLSELLSGTLETTSH
ncbi:MAG: RusA family crossover junction endodeoxyribonuclease [Prevotella sp.]|nr:RusA family crossover junction endodeoxyribonuclease [Prevotella sp.]